MNIRTLIMAIGLIALTSCRHDAEPSAQTDEPSPVQQQLIDAGWSFASPDEDLSQRYGIKPAYGTQDNYFDITIGEGCNMVVKIIDARTNQCIRYIFVRENSTTTVHEIPQGIYYLKLAYGRDWMEHEDGQQCIGKFTTNATYERSQELFDFGVKNSTDKIDYTLSINVVDNQLENNFKTIPISEEEFLK